MSFKPEFDQALRVRDERIAALEAGLETIGGYCTSEELNGNAACLAIAKAVDSLLKTAEETSDS